MKTKTTQNWTVVNRSRDGESGTIYEYVIKDEFGSVLAVIYDDELARPCAAAPQLLDALRLIAASEESMSSLSKMERGAINAAIALAEGR